MVGSRYFSRKKARLVALVDSRVLHNLLRVGAGQAYAPALRSDTRKLGRALKGAVGMDRSRGLAWRMKPTKAGLRVALVLVFIAAFAATALAAPGDLDSAFGSGGTVTTSLGVGSDKAVAVAIQLDGKLVVGGYSNNGTSDDFAIARYNTNGTLDAAFGSGGIVTTSFGGGTDHVHAIAIQGDGKIVAAGYATSSLQTDFALSRYNANGTLDTGFNTDGKVTTTIGSGNDEINGLALDGSGKIVVAGQSIVGTSNQFVVARYTAAGALDASFGSGGFTLTDIGAGSDAANAVVIDAAGKIVVGGRANNGVDRDFAIARFNANGSLDATFGNAGVRVNDLGPGDDYIDSLAIQPSDGKIVASGVANNGTNTDFAVVRYTTGGALDSSFGGTGKVLTNIGHNDEAFGVAVDADGKIVAAGTAAGFYFAGARYNADGTLDTPFGNNGVWTTAVSPWGSDGSAVAIQPSDGNIVVVGDAYTVNDDFAVARYLVGAPVASYQPDGSIKLGKGAYVGDNIYSAAGANESVLASTARGTTKRFTIKIENDGSATDSFTVLGEGAQTGFSVTYKQGTTDITSQVVAGTFAVGGLAPGAFATIKISITVKSTATVGATNSWLITLTSAADTSKLDAVTAKVKVSA